MEGVGMDFLLLATDRFIASFREEDVEVSNIEGLVKGTKTVGGETYETVKIILTEQNPKPFFRWA